MKDSSVLSLAVLYLGPVSSNSPLLIENIDEKKREKKKTKIAYKCRNDYSYRLLYIA